MKILWISFYGSWTKPLLSRLSVNHELAMIVPSQKEGETSEEGVKIYKIRLSEIECTNSMSLQIFKKYNRIIRSFSPDIIHVHGTEKNLGQIQNYIQHIPVVISIQGIQSGSIQFDNCFLSNEIMAPYKTIKNRFGRGGYLEMHRKLVKGIGCYEKDILKTGKYFFCRTNWDKAWICFSNPNAKVYQGEELLRDVFYERAGNWNLNQCNKHTIFMPSGFNPIKGFHLALKAVILLKEYFPDVILIVPGLPHHILAYEGLRAAIIGEEYVNYCKDIIRRNCLEKNVNLLPRLDASGMANEMIKANVFLSPSSIDNSPNAVGEAMMIGMPIVSTPVGGVTSFLHDNENCLIAPSGDEYMMAFQIKCIFEDSKVANTISKNAYRTAQIRHNPEATTTQYLCAYESIIETHRKSKDFI